MLSLMLNDADMPQSSSVKVSKSTRPGREPSLFLVAIMYGSRLLALALVLATLASALPMDTAEAGLNVAARKAASEAEPAFPNPEPVLVRNAVNLNPEPVL